MFLHVIKLFMFINICQIVIQGSTSDIISISGPIKMLILKKSKQSVNINVGSLIKSKTGAIWMPVAK